VACSKWYDLDDASSSGSLDNPCTDTQPLGESRGGEKTVGARSLLLAVNVVGGIAVLGSYAWGLATHPVPGPALWGGVPTTWRPLYGASMIPAALGYIAFATYLLFRVDPGATRFGLGLPYAALVVPFVLVLVPSALWMPLTLRFAEVGGAGLWWAIRIGLWTTAIGSLLLAFAVATVAPRVATSYWVAAVLGTVFFFFQTGILDGILWVAKFPGQR
jgi:hypothetical protein